MSLQKSDTYIAEIKSILEQARQKAYQAVNTAMVEAYWLIGKRIVEEEQNGKEKAEYGEAVLKNLSVALTSEFGKGFSYANLRNFRQFFLTYPDKENCYALRSKLTWTHHRLIMRVENPEARNYYLQETEEQNWSTRVFEPNIKPQKELFWNDRSGSRYNQWHMGHIKNKKYSQLVDEYISGEKSYDEFIAEYNNKDNYRPEDPKSNMSHKFE